MRYIANKENKHNSLTASACVRQANPQYRGALRRYLLELFLYDTTYLFDVRAVYEYHRQVVLYTMFTSVL